MQNWEECSIHHMAVLPFRRTSIGWRNGRTKVLRTGLGAIKGQCEILQRGGKNNPTHPRRLGVYWLESTVAEKNLGVLVNTKLTMSQQPTLLWQRHLTSLLGCISKMTCHQQVRRGEPSLVPQGDDFWSAVASPGFPSARVRRVSWSEFSERQQRWWRDWSICDIGRSWRSWGGFVWRREGSGGIWSVSINGWWWE